MRKNVDWSLYLVTDQDLAKGRSMIDIVRRAVAGGVSVVQLRNKSSSTRQLIQDAEDLLSLLRPLHIPLIINDRVDVALASDADGVHVGQEDMPAIQTRRLIGDDKILGVTASTPQEAYEAVSDGADYIGCNAVFWTPTKMDTGVPLGLQGFRQLVRSVSVPVVAIGGIKAENAGDLMRAGAAGVAVVSAIIAAEDPEWEAKALLKAVLAGRNTE